MSKNQFRKKDLRDSRDSKESAHLNFEKKRSDSKNSSKEIQKEDSSRKDRKPLREFIKNARDEKVCT